MHFHPDALTHQHISIRYCGSFISIQIPFFYEIHVKCESSIQCSTEIIMMTRSMGHHDYLRATLNASFSLHVNFTKKRDLDEKIWSALPYIRKASKNFTKYPIILWVDAGKTDIEFKFWLRHHYIHNLNMVLTAHTSTCVHLTPFQHHNHTILQHYNMSIPWGIERNKSISYPHSILTQIWHLNPLGNWA